MSKTPLAAKLFFWLIIIAIVPLTFLSLFYINVFEKSFLQQEQQQLSQLADQKINQIESYIDERIANTHFLSHSAEIKTALQQLSQAYYKYDINSEEYNIVAKSFNHIFQGVQEHGFYNIFLISPAGEIIYSIENELDFATNLYSGIYNNTNLSTVFQNASLMLETTSSAFSYYEPSDEMAAFIASPILDNGKVLGVIAVQIGTKTIQKTLMDVGVAMQSREIVVGSREGDFFIYQLPVKFSKDLPYGKKIPISKLPNPLGAAIKGQSTITITKDYRNIDVIAATRYIPSIRWGLVVKEDLAEAMLVVNDMVNMLWVVLTSIFFLVFLIASYLGRSIAKPITAMTHSSKTIAEGDFHIKIKPSGFKENYLLAKSFNKMSAYLIQTRENLEQLIEARTIELKNANIALKQENTDRLNAQTILIEREQNLAVTLNSIGDAVIVTDSVGCVVRMNPVAEQLTGWKLTQASGSPIKMVITIIDATTNKPIFNPIEQVLTTGHTVHISDNTTLLSKDGNKYHIVYSAAPICDDSAEITGMVLVFNDMTEHYRLRTQAQNNADQVRLLLDSTAEAIYGIDTSGVCTFVNKACLNILGYQQDLDIVGKNMHELIHYSHPNMDPYPVAECTIYEACQNEIGTHDDNAMLLRKDGSSFYAEYWSHPIFKNGYCIGSVITFFDITDRKCTEETLRQSQKMEALGKLTGGIAHDYNNMLGIIMGYAELLEQQLNDQPSLKKLAHEIHRAGTRGAKLTKKLLGFSRQKNPNKTIIDINQMLIEEQHMLDKILTANIYLSYELTDNIWPILIDDGDLEDAIINICINAMHAIATTGHLIITTKNEHLTILNAEAVGLNSGDYIVLSIKDDGCGMNEEIQAKIFDPFFSTKGEGGTGLGLSQVFGFVQRSNGAITVHSELGHGTQFKMYFPRHNITSSATGPNQAVNPLYFKGNESILVVDDEPALLNLTTEILNTYGYHVFSANNAKHALEIMESQHIDLLFSDIIMPEMNGYELATIIKQQQPHIKIQLASGFDNTIQNHDAENGLHTKVLNKPYNEQTLLKAIRLLLDE